MMQTEGAVVGQRVFNQGISILAVSFGQTLVALVEINAVTLNPC